MAKDGKKKARKKNKAKNGQSDKRAEATRAPDRRWTRPTAMALAAGAILVAGVTNLWRSRR